MIKFNLIKRLFKSAVCKVKMAEDDMAFLLDRGEVVEPHENEQAEVSVPENVFFVFLK
jgi:hypothetical protein